MPTVNVKIADIKDPVVVKVSEMGYIRGQDGISPTVETEKIDGIEHCIVIEDGAGNKWCFLPGPGSDGDVVIEDDNGNQWHMPAGEAGSGEIAAQDGGGGAWHLPVGSDGSGYRITITDKDGEHVAYVWNGERGADGRQGVDGQPGQDGFSPLVSMTEITGGYCLTITDKQGAHSVNIYNGEESVIFIAEYGMTTQEELDVAYSEGKLIFVRKNGLCRLLTSTSLYQPTPTAEGIRNYTFALYRPDIKQVETVYWLADGRGWTATTASADWQSKITASGILKGDGNGGVSAATVGTDYLAPSALTPYRTSTEQDAIDAGLVSAVNAQSLTATQQAQARNNIGAIDAGSIATIESSPATQAHAIGDYIVYNGQLYKVTAAITAGQTLTPGTNIEISSVDKMLQYTEVSGVETNVKFNLPKYAHEVYLDCMFEKGQHINFYVQFPATSYTRIDSGFYYTPTACGSGAVNAVADRSFILYRPYYAGTEISAYTSIRCWYR